MSMVDDLVNAVQVTKATLNLTIDGLPEILDSFVITHFLKSPDGKRQALILDGHWVMGLACNHEDRWYIDYPQLYTGRFGSIKTAALSNDGKVAILGDNKDVHILMNKSGEWKCKKLNPLRFHFEVKEDQLRWMDNNMLAIERTEQYDKKIVLYYAYEKFFFWWKWRCYRRI